MGAMSVHVTEPAGATPVTERSLAPDLARRFMLLWIALAPTMTWSRSPVVGTGEHG